MSFEANKKRDRDETCAESNSTGPVLKKRATAKPVISRQWYTDLKAELLAIPLSEEDPKPYHILVTSIAEDATGFETLLKFPCEGAARRWYTLLHRLVIFDPSTSAALARVTLSETEFGDIFEQLSSKTRELGSAGTTADSGEAFLKKILETLETKYRHDLLLDAAVVAFSVLVQMGIIQMPESCATSDEYCVDNCTTAVPWENATRHKFDMHVRIASFY